MPTQQFPRITFGMIVLNGLPFIKYNLKGLYPYAHQIIVVEGACKSASAISDSNGHSNDGTIEEINNFKSEFDNENKITVITAEDEGKPNGFWDEKDEMSQAYAKRATGDYLWQVDVDEFYKSEDIEFIIKMLGNDPSVSSVSFKQIGFFRDFNYVVKSWHLKLGAEIFHRLFKWGKGYKYLTHRPPTVLDSKGNDTKLQKYVDGYKLSKAGVYLYHYYLLFPKQVLDKCEYYNSASWAERSKASEWAKTNYFELSNPYRLHNVYDYPGWIEHFIGSHPNQIQEMREDIDSGRLDIKLTDNTDLIKLVKSYRYNIGTFFLKLITPLFLLWKIHIEKYYFGIRRRIVKLSIF